MALDSLVKSAVKIAHKATKSLQQDVQHKAWIGRDGQLGGQKLAPPRLLTALVEQKLQTIKLADGRFVQTKAKLTFLQEITPNGAEGRVEPIDSRDTLILADGTTGPIYILQGLESPSTDRPFLLEVWLGV